ncbi:DUF3311 domain-containing protein [Adhaeretor mobilis]|uniref:DUF3311 domain-containing protein n=1 Tax=Adhaeretor mobilis TaxID=1930276 RepID=A0A517N1Y6_9BACT|nr:DUF3311 domain-containing protein [Adhaeretor mobilis]QDT01152.1 hypothetical protein HG15A2_44940 [Adhaeretor mobilis]
MLRFIWPLVILLLILHQDNWFWDDGTLVFGFIPVGLFYHACISVAAATTWFLVVLFCWPKGLDEKVSHESTKGEQSV